MNKKTIKDISVKGKRVLVRVDFNVPLDNDGKIISGEQIQLHIPTLAYLIEQGAKIILLTHLGNPGFKKNEALRVDVLQQYLEKILQKKIQKNDGVMGISVDKMIQEMQEGDIILLENIRFYEEEKENDHSFAKKLSDLCDIFVNDSFGTCHRMHASTVGIAQYVPAVAGLLLEKEILTLETLFKNPKKPFTLILGGNKCDVKMQVIRNFLHIADNFLIGGGLANTCLYAQGFEVGMSYVEKEKMEEAQELMLTIESNNEHVILPEDMKVADTIGNEVPVLNVPVEDIGFGMKMFDIGNKTIEKFISVIRQSETIVWSGPLGVFEYKPFRYGTELIAKALAVSDKTTIVGGGETLDSLIEFGIPFSKFTHVSTGGGAMLAFLQGQKLPAIEVLEDR